MKPSEVLNHARTVMLERGLAQRNVFDDVDGSVCPLGAVLALTEGRRYLDAAENRACDYLRKATGLGSVICWTYEGGVVKPFNDVMGLFDDAILFAKEAGE